MAQRGNGAMAEVVALCLCGRVKGTELPAFRVQCPIGTLIAPAPQDGMVMLSDKPAFGDLMDCPVDIDRRMLDYLVGLDSEFNEVLPPSSAPPDPK